MKKFAFLLLTVLFMNGMLQASTTLEVGPDKTYKTISEAWIFAIADSGNDFVIKVDAGTFVEPQIVGAKPGLKITITGAGANQTIIKRSESITFGLTSGENPGRLILLSNAATDTNIQVALENMSFQTMGFTNAGGGGVINAIRTNQKITFRNCNFKNIFARSGAVIQASAVGADITFDSCFFEECGSFDNNSQNGIIYVTNGICSVSNCSFMNNTFDAINRGNTGTGNDMDRKSGGLISLNDSVTSGQITNCNFINNRFISGDQSKIHPIIGFKPNLTIFPVIALENVISVGNQRDASLDCDVYYLTTTTLTTKDVVFNAVKNYDAAALAYNDVSTLPGATINGTIKPDLYFEMEGDLPKISTNSAGAKMLVRKTTGINQYHISDLKVWSDAGVLNVKSENPQDVSIHDTTGRLVAKFNNTTSVQKTFAKGMYIVKTDKDSLTVIVK